MTRTLDINKTLVLATHNAGKLKEITDLMSPFGFTVISAGDLDLPEPEETGTTFEENALIKAHAISQATGLPALADDSGLAVDTLNGDPGVYAARFAGPNRDYAVAMKKINSMLDDNPNRKASFISSLAVVWPDGHEETFEGKVEGSICWPPRGQNGFAYDPFFVPTGETETFGEMTIEKKQTMSHRKMAFDKFVDTCIKGNTTS